MKFKRLSNAELMELEDEFVQFLIVNGIVADDWVKLKSESKDKADRIIDQFSDVVYTQIFRKKQFIDFVSRSEIKCFQFLEKSVVLVGLKTNDESIDFTTSMPKEISKSEFEIYTTSKTYTKSREEEMFHLIENGASISEGELFKNLCLSL